MMRLAVFVLGLLVLIPAFVLSQADGFDVTNSTNRIFPYKYEVRDLVNGLRVVVIPTDFPNIVSLKIVISTGSRNEVDEGKTGFAHFFEHMMFRGSKNYSSEDRDEILKEAGADSNAFTTDDNTVYFSTFTKEDLDAMLKLEADRFQNLQYSEADFRTEALAIIGEYNKNYANPFTKLLEVQRAAAFTKHPYRHTTMGFIEDIKDMPNQFEYSLEFYERYYRPENAVIIVSGEVEPSNVFELVEQYWSSWEPGLNGGETIPSEPEPDGPVYTHVSWETETLPWVTVGFRGPGAYPTADNVAPGDMQTLDVLFNYAFSGSSDLYKRLVVDEQKVNYLSSYNPDHIDPYLLTARARLNDPADMVYVRGVIQETLAMMRTTLPDEARINDIKSAVKYGFAAGMDNSEALAAAIVRYVAATRDVELINEVYRNYDRVTPEDIQRVANTYFIDQGMIVVELSTGEPDSNGMETGSVDNLVTSATSDLMPTNTSRVQIPRFEGAEPSGEPLFEELITKNSSPIINFRFLFEVGAADDPVGKEGLAALTASMVTDAGSEAILVYEDIPRSFYPMAAYFSSQVDKEMTVFHGSIHLDNLDDYYDIMASQLFTPAFREKDFTRVKTLLLNSIRVDLRSKNDEELGKEVLYEMIYAGHPYGHLNFGHAEAIENLTIQDVVDFYEAHYVQPVLTVGIAGNIPDTFLERLRNDLNGELPRFGAALDRPVPQADPPNGLQVTLVNKDTRAAAISLGFPIKIRRGDADFVALYLIRSFFGEHRQPSYLFQRIREIRGMNYGDYAYIEYFPNGMFQFVPDPNNSRQQQIFQIWIRPVPLEQTHFALRIAMFELERLVRDGISVEDFEATRKFLMKYTSLLTATQDRVLGYAIDSEYYGTGEFVDYIRSGLGELTVEEVNRALQRHLQSENIAAVVIMPGAEAFRDTLLADSPSPMEYPFEMTDEVNAEDKIIQQYQLNLTESDIRVISVSDVFERRMFGSSEPKTDALGNESAPTPEPLDPSDNESAPTPEPLDTLGDEPAPTLAPSGGTITLASVVTFLVADIVGIVLFNAV